MDLLLIIGGAIVSNAPNLVGFILPPFVELLNKDVKNDNARFIVSLITCLLVAVFLHWNDIAVGDPSHAVIYAGIIFTECNVIFKLYFDNSWLRQKIQTKIGNAGVGTIASQVDNGIIAPDAAIANDDELAGK